MKKFTFLFILLLAAVSCRKVEREPLGPTDIRVRNLSSSVMTNLIVETGGGNYNYGTVNAGAVTSYNRFSQAYPKANISAFINGQKYKTDTAIYTYMQYLGTIKATYEIIIKSDAQKKLEISNVLLDENLK